jgi:hypothetical protein
MEDVNSDYNGLLLDTTPPTSTIAHLSGVKNPRKPPGSLPKLATYTAANDSDFVWN